MENERMLEILDKIQICLKRNSMDTAKELINIELNNLKEITQENCKNTKYYFYEGYCKYCNNLNCRNNKKEKA